MSTGMEDELSSEQQQQQCSPDAGEVEEVDSSSVDKKSVATNADDDEVWITMLS